ncbi:MAG: hypothetical protein AAGA66_07460 [Bacteroidota bacterium]
MRNSIFSLTIFILSFLPALAQEETGKKVAVYYQDGSVFVGQVISEKADGMKLRLSTNDTIAVNPFFIKKIRDWKNNGVFHYEKGYFANVSFSLGSSSYFGSHGEANLTFGKRFNEKWAAGIGVGRAGGELDVARSVFLYHSFTTLYGYGRYYLGKGTRKVKPYVDTRIGYGFIDEDVFFFNVNNEQNGGAYYSPGIGLHFASKNSVKWHISISRYSQNVSGTRTDNFGPFNNPIVTDYNAWSNSFMVRFGIEIK